MMESHRIDLDKTRWAKLCDGIVFFWQFNRWKPSEVAAIPEERVRIVYRAMPPTVWTMNVTIVEFAAVAPFFMLMLAGLHVLVGMGAAAIVACVLTLAAVTAYGLLTVRHGRRLSRCTTQLTAEIGCKTFDLTFDRIEGQDPAIEDLLDRLRYRRAFFNVRSGPAGAAVLFHKPLVQHLKATSIALAFLLFWYGNARDPEALPWLGLPFLLFGAILLVWVLIALPFETIIPEALRSARSALLADEPEAARLVLEHFLAAKPRHVYGNFLMVACALMEGDIVRAAIHRRAMHGRYPHDRAAEILFTLTHTVSSVKTFQSLAEYVQRSENQSTTTQPAPNSRHEQPAH